MIVNIEQRISTVEDKDQTTDGGSKLNTLDVVDVSPSIKESTGNPGKSHCKSQTRTEQTEGQSGNNSDSEVF